MSDTSAIESWSYFPTGEPKAFIDRDWAMDRVRIHLGTRAGDSLYVMRGDGTIREYRGSETATSDTTDQPYLTLPGELARCLLDALAAFYGGVSEARQLRADYNAERARVDRLIAHLTGDEK